MRGAEKIKELKRIKEIKRGKGKENRENVKREEREEDGKQILSIFIQLLFRNTVPLDHIGQNILCHYP